MRSIVIALLLALVPAVASATATTYTGSLIVPTGGGITVTGAASGCAVFNSSGALSSATCPNGTAAFSATSPITVTGSGPYTIGCSTCFQNTGGTISGATTFSAATTFNTLPTTTVGLTNSSATAPITSPSFVTGSTTISSGGAAFCSTISGTALTVTYNGSRLISVDGNGNQCNSGTIYYISKRADKFDIHAGHINGLGALLGANLNLCWRYKAHYGNPNQVRCGPMADDLPDYISGPHHDRIDLEALVVTEGIAIKQLTLIVAILVCWVLVLTVLVVRARR